MKRMRVQTQMKVTVKPLVRADQLADNTKYAMARAGVLRATATIVYVYDRDDVMIYYNRDANGNPTSQFFRVDPLCLTTPEKAKRQYKKQTRQPAALPEMSQ